MADIKTVKVSYDYSAGGYPNPTYTGKRSFGMNIFVDAQEEDVKEKASERAFRDCKQSMGSNCYVKIKNLTVGD